MQVVKEFYSIKSHIEMSLGFDGEAILLSVPNGGMELDNGWKIKPFHDPIVSHKPTRHSKYSCYYSLTAASVS